MKLDIAHSPCPNDTFIFHAWTQGYLEGAPDVNVHMGDIEELNEWAMAGRYPVVKVSFGALPQLLDRYQVLASGAALGRNCGPLIVGRSGADMSGFKSMRVAIPGRHTTANLLMQLLCPQAKELVEMRYDHIAPAVQNGSVDAGLIIHETRFCLDKWGLISLCDVGQLWEEEYQSPVPLGCIVVDRSLSLEKRLAIADCIRRSLNYAWEQPEASQEYIAEHAQEIEADVRQAHISLYVNEESSQLSAAACAGIRTLLELAQKRAGRAFSMEEAILDPSTALRHPA